MPNRLPYRPDSGRSSGEYQPHKPEIPPGDTYNEQDLSPEQAAETRRQMAKLTRQNVRRFAPTTRSSHGLVNLTVQLGTNNNKNSDDITATVGPVPDSAASTVPVAVSFNPMLRNPTVEDWVGRYYGKVWQHNKAAVDRPWLEQMEAAAEAAKAQRETEEKDAGVSLADFGFKLSEYEEAFLDAVAAENPGNSGDKEVGDPD